MLDIEYLLVEKYHWSLYELDQTDVESLLPFMDHVFGGGSKKSEAKLTTCDQVSWL